MTADPSVRAGAQGVIAVIAVVFLIVGAVAIGTHFRRPAIHADLSLNGWQPSQKDWEHHRQQEAQLAQKVTVGPDEETVLAAVADLSRAELSNLDREPDESLRAATTRVEIAAERYFLKHGADAYRGLGVVAAQKFAEALVKLLNHARQQKVKAAEIPHVFADDPLYLQWNEVGGNFLNNALRSGLVSPLGELQPGAEIVVPLLFASRWNYFVRGLGRTDVLETSFARLVLLKWKVESHHGLTMERRHELIREILALQPDYPADDVLGRLYAKYSDWQRSAEYFEKALARHPANPTLRANLEYAKSQIRSQ